MHASEFKKTHKMVPDRKAVTTRLKQYYLHVQSKHVVKGKTTHSF
jgi:hypothetical protein